jgi:hypothetical protein
MAPEVKTAKNSKLPKLPENCFEPVGKGGWPPISTWISPGIRMICLWGCTLSRGKKGLKAHKVKEAGKR